MTFIVLVITSSLLLSPLTVSSLDTPRPYVNKNDEEVFTTRTTTPTLGKINDSIGNLGGFGYAVDRNKARWELIRRAVAAEFGLERVGSSLVGVDFGADQGYFALSLAVLFRELRSRSAAHRIAVAAVEKGGVGGSIWATRLQVLSSGDGRRGSSVHDIFRQKVAAARQLSMWDNASTMLLCPAEISSTTIDAMSSRCAGGSTSGGGGDGGNRHGAVDVQLFLSMLHWVHGVDGERGLCNAVCAMSKSSRLTFLELPHPHAKRTFGEKRYRKWYAREKNVTRLLERCMEECPAPSDVSRSAQCGDDASGVVTVMKIGQTPWGGKLFREIHLVRNPALCSTWPESMNCLQRIMGKCESV